MSLLRVENLSVQLDGVTILENLSLEVEQGEVFCLIGPNGCGKTTLLDCILGWLKPQSGRVMLWDKCLEDYSLKSLAREIAYVPQSHDKTFPYTVKDIVLMGRNPFAGPLAGPGQADITITEQILERLGLTKYRDRPYTKISGGEGQLVMIARALAQQTPLIIMDEPTAHLDLKHEFVILETIAGLVRKNRISVIMATHFPNHAFQLENYGVPTRVGLMTAKGSLLVGKPQTVLDQDQLARIYNIDARVISHTLESSRAIKQIVPLGLAGGCI